MILGLGGALVSFDWGRIKCSEHAYRVIGSMTAKSR